MPAVVKTRTEEGRQLLGLVTAVAGQAQDTSIHVDAALPGACMLPGSESACTLKDAVLYLAAPAPQLLGASDDLKPKASVQRGPRGDAARASCKKGAPPGSWGHGSGHRCSAARPDRPPTAMPDQVAAYVEQHSELALPTAEALSQLNAELEPRTFLTGPAATLADLVVYAAVAPALVRAGGKWVLVRGHSRSVGGASRQGPSTSPSDLCLYVRGTGHGAGKDVLLQHTQR